MKQIIVFICLFLIGLCLIPLLPVKLNPYMELPGISVSFSMRNQSAQVIEAEVTSKLEALFSRIKGVQNISSYSTGGSGSINLELSKYTDVDAARFEVATIIRQAWNSLPQGVSYPSVSISGARQKLNNSFLHYTVNAPFSPVQIQEYIDNTVKPKIAEIRGVDEVQVRGAGQMIYKLEYDYEQLQNLNISANDIRTAIQSYLSHEHLGIGKIRDENRQERWIRVALTSGSNRQAFDPSLIQVKNNSGTIIRLDQLVKLSFEEEEAVSYFRINGLNSVYLSVTAKDDANQVKLSKQIQNLVTRLQENFPAGYELHLAYDAGEYIQKEMNKIYFRSGLTIFILLCFVFLIYRNLKYSLLILISLIVNLAVSIIFYYLFGLELHLYSLAGVTISLTLMIDNTIIMSDQIIRQGNRKAFMAILAATLTTVCSLAIVLLMNESVRANLQDFAGVVIINLSVSLFIALFFVPAWIEKFEITKKQEKIKSSIAWKRIFVRFNKIYEKLIYFTYTKKMGVIALVILIFGLPVFLLPEKIGKPVFGMKIESGFGDKLYNQTFGSIVYKEHIKPVSDVVLGGVLRLFIQKVRKSSYSAGEKTETSLHITASLPNGATKDQMNALILKMENYIKQYPEVRQFTTTIENGQRANIRILFEKNYQSGSFPYMLKTRLTGKALELGGGSWGVYGVGDGFSNDVKEQAGSYQIKFFGYNYDQLNVFADALKDSLLQYPRIKDVIIDSKFSWYKDDYMEFIFDLDKTKLARENIFPAQLFNSINPLLERNSYAGAWTTENQTIPVRLFSLQANELNVWDLENYPQKATSKEFKPAGIAHIEKSQVPQNIAKENQQYCLYLQYDYIGPHEQGRKVMERTIESFNQTIPLGYKAESVLSVGGWNNYQSGQYWFLLLIIAVIFFTTGILFNSVRQPLVIIFIIPVSYIGLFLSFYFFNANFDQGGFAAFILLTGLSVNSNIYILNEYNRLKKLHPSFHPVKIYLKAWNAKIRPIFLTVLSTVLGFLPFIAGYRESFWFPLATGIIGGLTVSLLGTFLLLPLLMKIHR